ncbi:MAG: SIS domain-containing protein [Cocleimonas sp.]|nr:SIS domain-containing protein [Cocleimonas sp.]
MHRFNQVLVENQAVITALKQQTDQIEAAGRLIITCLKKGNKLLFCGNGGSAADSQHLAAEFMVRYVDNRRPLPAIALTTDTSILTAHTNDFSFDTVFSRQIESLGRQDDCLIAFSTSGNSNNILQAVKVAQEKKLKVIILTGQSAGNLAAFSEMAIIIRSPSNVTARIQETHILIGHWWCQLADETFMTK